MSNAEAERFPAVQPSRSLLSGGLHEGARLPTPEPIKNTLQKHKPSASQSHRLTTHENHVIKIFLPGIL
jgi:hypothetical protein